MKTARKRNARMMRMTTTQMLQLLPRAIGAATFASLALSVVACEPAPLPEDEDYAPSVAIPACVANNDGTIERGELPFAVGIKARYRIAQGEVSVDVKGDVKDGQRVWDFSRPDPSEEPVALLGPVELADYWFADRFPTVEIAGPLTAGSDILGPMRIDDAGVHLYGLASADENPPSGQSLAIYDAPVTLYPFPLSLGVREVSEVRASGATLLGIPTAFNDRYDVEVTEVGTLRLPDLILENTLRLTIRFERTLLAGDVKQVSHVFMHECLGEVARVVSPAVAIDEELDDNFEFATEVRRLSL